MREGWKRLKLKDFAQINPREQLKKGTLAKKIPMEALQPFNKKIETYVWENYKGGVKFRNGDTLVARITPSLENGKTAYVDILDDGEVAFGSTEFIVLREKEGISDKQFLYYLAVSPEFREVAIQSMTGSSGRQRVQNDVIENYEFDLPPLPIQKKIAHILSTFDEKIELNRRMNRTLEAMAQAIFKSWFVDFDPVHAKAAAKTQADLDVAAKRLGISREILDLFPDEFEESELGMIPKGWEVKPFSTIVELNTQSVKPFQQPDQLWEHYSIPAFDDGMIPVMEYGKEIKSNKYKVDKNAILASKLNPSTPRTWLPYIKNPEYAICSTEFMQFVPKIDTHRPFVYELVISEYFQNEIKSCVTGTTGSRQRAQPKQVIQIPVILPTIELIDRFCDIVNPLLIKILNNREETSILQASRNVLLPNLLTGKIDLSSLEG